MKDPDLITYDNLAKASAANSVTFQHLRTRDDAKGAEWSDTYTDGNDYGIVITDDTEAILDTTPHKQKKVKKPTWNKYVPPEPPPQP